ncbi:ABC transporter permease [Nocardioides humi]|uniref:Ribose ABC transporter permease n=1 Tax=Nocardioides humi TaxID=449461 RepID=A0ABN2ATD8_9ACTN|nr:ABC transporter permease [Nocardioides humi]
MSETAQLLEPHASSTPPPPVARRAKSRDRWALVAQNYGTPAALVVLVIFFALASDNFADPANLKNILIQISPLLIVAVGITVPMAAGDYDLSVGANAGLVGLLCTGMLAHGSITSVPLAFLIGVLVGAAIGLVNGFLISWIGFPSLIATLAMMSVLQGLNTAYSGGLSIFNGIPVQFTDIAAGGIAYVPTLIVIAALASAVIYLLMHRRPTGRHLYALGSSFGVARLVGIRIAPTRTLAMVISGIAAAVAGMLLASRLGAGVPSAGDGFLLSSLTVVFLGMTMYRIGRANVPGTIVGALFYGVLQNGLNIMGVDSAGQSLATGLVLMAAVAFAVFRNRNND